MLKRTIKLEDIQGLGAGKTAIINCPVGPRYHKIRLTLGDTADSDGNVAALSALAGEIKILMAGAIQRRATATQIDVIQTAYGAGYGSQAYNSGTAGAGRRHLDIHFREPWRTRITAGSVDLDALGWQTGWLGRNDIFQVHVAIPSGITPVLSASAIVDDFSTGRPHAIMKWFTDTQNVSGASFTHNNLERRDAYAQISCFDTSDAKTVDQVRLEVGGVPIIEDLTKNENTTDLKAAGMNPAAGAFHIVFDPNDALEDLLPTGSNSMKLKMDFSASATGTIDLITQRFGLPEGQ